MGQAFTTARGGGGALLVEGAEGSDFVADAGVLGVGEDPGEDFAVPEPFGYLRLEGFGIDAEEVEDVLVEGAVIGVFPILPSNVARALSSMRGRITRPPRRQRGLRGGCWVRS